MQHLVARAPAKVNLTLRVLHRREDGFHDLASLVVFAGASDLLTLEPGPVLALDVSGPRAQASGAAQENLVLKAARALSARIPGLRAGQFRLIKRLPVAAGLGGGSSDAAAALRLLAQLNDLALEDPRLFDAARSVGSDVPVCLDPRARMMAGVGDLLSAPIALPPLFAVLVNCGIAVATPQVFGAIGLKRGDGLEGPNHPDHLPREMAALLPVLAAIPNDMESAAVRLAPEIGQVMRLLEQAPEARLVRMSGSGATVFALTSDCREAARLAHRIATAQPGWWVRPTVLR